ncbi:MAG: hypothetical protein GY757_56970 [bacterium]|nr:hypothetical protein [bacterium]
MAEQTNKNEQMYRKPVRTFEKSGVVNPKTSYYVSLDNVVNSDNQDIKTMVNLGRYFSIFAPRQSGKTTFFKRMCDELHKDPMYVAVVLDFQNYESLNRTDFYSQIEENLYYQLLDRLKIVGCQKTEKVEQFLDGHHLTDHLSMGTLFKKLNRIIEFKKIVIFIDEFDGIPLSELGSFLTTLRSLYQQYKEIEKKALYSIGLVGIRNITKLIVGGVSPFNIADQIDLPAFSLKNITDLYGQYTRETNQPFTIPAVEKVYRETGGQPWLINRLGTILTVNVKPGTVEAINETDVEQAIQILLMERNDHFDNLYEKALQHKETFVEIVFDHVEYNPYNEDQSWLEQYGLIKNRSGHAVVANNIYKAVHLKAFFKEAKIYEDKSPNEYLLPGDRLDMERIILDFEQYITQIGIAAFYQKQAVSPAGSTVNQQRPYEKTGQFLLTAWLYQFVKKGTPPGTSPSGELRYEVFTGMGRMDVLLTYKGHKYIIETKINRRNLTRTINDGIKQVTGKYLIPETADEGYLIIFDAKTPCGSECEPEYHNSGDKKITSFTIAIGS